MRQKFAVATTLLVLISGSALAASPEDVETSPGLVSASSPLYDLDVAFDNAAVQAGLTDPGDVAFERASEVSQTYENNRSMDAENALNNLNSIAEAASSNSTSGLDKAQAVLNQVRERVPEQARSGIDNALGNIERAKRRPSGVGQGRPT